MLIQDFSCWMRQRFSVFYRKSSAKRRVRNRRFSGNTAPECLELRMLLSAITVSEVEPNDTFATAQSLPLGFDSGEYTEVDVNGFVFNSATDDYFSVHLDKGDVIGLNYVPDNPINARFGIYNSAEELQVLSLVADYNGAFASPDSPFSTGGRANFTYNVPETGLYYITLEDAVGFSAYDLDVDIARPGIESEVVGTRQKIFLDFDGLTGFNSAANFPGATVTNADFEAFDTFLPNWGVVDPKRWTVFGLL